MDTILLQRPQFEKAATSAAGIGIALCLLLVQNPIISAKDGLTGISPRINYLKEQQEQKEQIFEQEIVAKYSKSNVVEIEKGVKYVRMIRFYQNKPVRINIVELSQGVNDNLVIEPSIASDTLAHRSKIKIGRASCRERV